MKSDIQLNEKQTAFVREFVKNGGNATAAARAAGYNAPSQRAYELVRMPHVADAIRAEQSRQIGSLVSLSLGTLRGIMEDPEASNRDKQAAARTALEAGGFLGRMRESITDSDEKPLHEMTREELAEFIAAEKRAIAELEAAAEGPACIDITPDTNAEAALTGKCAL